MKIPLPDNAVTSLDAPVLPALAILCNDVSRWLVWCRYCQLWHRHGAQEGHREAHCTETTPYTATGYNLVYAGDWELDQPMPEE